MKTALLAIGTLVLSGCEFDSRVGPTEHETQSIELDKSEMARVEIRMGAGELRVDGGSAKLMDADFTYNVPSWKPVVKYMSTGVRGELTVEQPNKSHGASKMNYRWELKLNNSVPLDVLADLGAGEADLNLGSLNLRSVQVNMGVGEIRLDLRGKPTRDYTVDINGGVGHARVYLPSDVGIIANATGGIGDVNVRGLEKRGSTWINAAHENAPVTIHVDIKGGIGQIEVIAE